MTIDIAMQTEQLFNSIVGAVKDRLGLRSGRKVAMYVKETDFVVKHLLRDATLDMLIGDEQLLRAAKQVLHTRYPDLHLDAKAHLLHSKEMRSIVEDAARDELRENLSVVSLEMLSEDVNLRQQVVLLLTQLAPDADLGKSTAEELLFGYYSTKMIQTVLDAAEEEAREAEQVYTNS